MVARHLGISSKDWETLGEKSFRIVSRRPRSEHGTSSVRDRSDNPRSIECVELYIHVPYMIHRNDVYG